MLRDSALVLHVLAVVVWVGSSVLAGVLAARATVEAEPTRGAVLALVRTTFSKVSTPALLLAWVAGLAMFVLSFDAYRHAVWLHVKITVALVLSGLHGALLARMRPERAAKATPNTFGALTAGVVGCAVVAVALVLLRP
jgi:protoporphyrinogen IX oxidase